MTEGEKKVYEPPTLKKVDLVAAGKSPRFAAATPAFILADSPTSISNVSGGTVFGPAPPPAAAQRKRSTSRYR